MKSQKEKIKTLHYIKLNQIFITYLRHKQGKILLTFCKCGN